jgi:hypothetical protein
MLQTKKVPKVQVRIPEDLRDEAKIEAVRRHMTLEEYVALALRKLLPPLAAGRRGAK